MRRAGLWLYATALLSCALPASANDARLVLERPNQLDWAQRAAGDRASPSPSSLDLVLGAATADGVSVTVPSGGLRFAEPRAAATRYPSYELLAPATGTLESGPRTSLRIDAKVRVVWSANAPPMTYDVILTASPSSLRSESGALDVLIQAWKEGADLEQKPTLSALVSGALE